MKYLKLVPILLFLSLKAFSQAPYDVNLISKDLTSRASSVVRKMEMNIDVKELDNVSHKIKKVITVLNKNGDEDAAVYLWYDKSRQIKSVKGVIYDQFGKTIGKFSEKEFRDYSASGGSFFDDSRIKTYFPAVTSYPYTLECEYEIKSKQTLTFPDWYPNNSTGVSVENAVLQFTCKPEFKIRVKELNYLGKKTVIKNDDNTQTYIWKVSNLKAVRSEPYSPNNEEYLTSIRIAPENFEYLGITGSFNNWKEMGLWMSEKLLKGRGSIPEATASKIKDITKDIVDPKLKAKKIYEFMQQKTRYISVQIGIGGFQPMMAEEVDRTSYGDCKALANYTQGLLKVAGINSYYAVVSAGNTKQSAIPDFASMNQFNHAILCIPFEKDTTWIDCTSKENPFGYIGDFTDDRLALICTETGGKLIRTTKFEDASSRQIRKAKFQIAINGDLTGDMETSFEGSQYDNRATLINEGYAEKLKKLQQIYSIDNLKIDQVIIKQDKSYNPITTEFIKLTANNYGSINDKYLYVPLNMVNRSSSIRDVRNRINSVYINRGYIDIDEITYILPNDYKIDLKPENLNIQYPFGHYITTFEINGNTIKYTRTMQLNHGTYKSEVYSDLVKFYQTAEEADYQKITLIAK